MLQQVYLKLYSSNIKALHFLILSLIFSLMACQSNPDGQKEQDSQNYPENGVAKIEFDAAHFDFGNILQGEQVSHTYQFTNTGNAPLIVQSASASCGCTVPKFSKSPIKPGETGMVEVVFDSSGRNGYQYKEVVLTTNSDKKNISLTFVANINKQ